MLDRFDGIGDDNRAVDVARGIEVPYERPSMELGVGEEPVGTGSGLEEEPLVGVDMAMGVVGRNGWWVGGCLI